MPDAMRQTESDLLSRLSRLALASCLLAALSPASSCLFAVPTGRQAAVEQVTQLKRGLSGARFSAVANHSNVRQISLVWVLATAATGLTSMSARRLRRGRMCNDQMVICKAGPSLIGSMGSRSPLVNWYLHEIGQDFEMIDAGQVDRQAPDYPHPFGQIPALRDGDCSVFESGAILMYIADKYGGLDTPEKRAEANKWIVWANATLDGICFKEDGNGRVLDTGLRGDPKQMKTLDAMLADQEFILGNGEDAFSVADVAIGSYLLFTVIFFPDLDVSKWPNIQRYMLQLCQRPAYAQAFGGGTSADLVKILSRKGESKMFGLF